jgi:hypothetical protein
MLTMSVTTTAQVSSIVPAGTLVETSGQSAAFEVGRLAGKPVLLILVITDAIEQESLHVSIWGSTDGTDWGTQALFWLPQKFYRGLTPAALDLGKFPALRFLQARWEVNRWGRGSPRPVFQFGIEIQELSVPAA